MHRPRASDFFEPPPKRRVATAVTTSVAYCGEHRVFIGGEDESYVPMEVSLARASHVLYSAAKVATDDVLAMDTSETMSDDEMDGMKAMMPDSSAVEATTETPPGVRNTETRRNYRRALKLASQRRKRRSDRERKKSAKNTVGEA